MAKVCVEFDAGGEAPGATPVRTYSTLVGTGSQTEFVVDHNLGVREVALLAYDVATGEVRQDMTTFLTNAERATVQFDTAPAANGVRLYAVGVRPAV